MSHTRAAGVVLLALVVVGCTPSSSEPPQPTLTPSLPTPTESEIERHERLDYAAAEKAYREFRAEYRKVTHDGGAKAATSTMKKTAGGPYLAEHVRNVRSYWKVKGYQRGSEKIVYVTRGLHSDTRLTFEACEDGRTLKSYTRDGEYVGGGDFLKVSLEARRVGGRWKVWSGTGKKVKTCS